MESPWLNIDAAAEYLSVSPGTLRNWRSAGSGPRYRMVGRIVRYHRDDLNTWLSGVSLRTPLCCHGIIEP
jgi:excisionase family DNA binding protein